MSNFVEAKAEGGKSCMKQKKGAFYILLLAVLLAACGNDAEIEDEVQGREVNREIKELPVVEEKITLSAVGDILIHDRVYDDAETEEGYDFSPMLAEVKPYLEEADITVANQETMIGGEEIGLSGYPSFNSP